MRKVQNGEWAPFWCTLLIFTRDDGKWFMPLIIVHQAKEYSQDIHFNTPLDWTVHHTPYGYMDRDRWLKVMTQLSNIYGASPVNNHTIFFNGHKSHSDDWLLRHMECQNIQPFVLKSGDSTKYYPNDNGPNTKMKYLYNEVKYVWILKYGTTTFLPHHMNSLLVEAWDAFKVSWGEVKTLSSHT